MSLEPGNVLQDRYRIVSLLGQGGMAAVYRAWDMRLEIPVALKEMIPQPGLDAAKLSQLHRQFEKEARLLARLNHAHLVRVGDFFEEKGSAYLTMDFVEGESLAERIGREGPLAEKDVLSWTEQLLDALAYCHAQGVIHRDIKPQNVIIRPDGQALLVDFGLVKLWDPSDPRTKTQIRGMGTPEYAPPEQYDIEVGHTDARTDIYGLGATVYHALAGSAPPTATLRMADPEKFRPLDAVSSDVSKHAADAVMKALALARPQRWQSAQEMAAALSTDESTEKTRHRVLGLPAWVLGISALLLLALIPCVASIAGIGCGGPTATPTATKTVRGVDSLLVEETATATPSRSPEPTNTATATVRRTRTPTEKPTGTNTPTKTASPRPIDTSTATLMPTATKLPPTAPAPTAPTATQRPAPTNPPSAPTDTPDRPPKPTSKPLPPSDPTNTPASTAIRPTTPPTPTQPSSPLPTKEPPPG